MNASHCTLRKSIRASPLYRRRCIQGAGVARHGICGISSGNGLIRNSHYLPRNVMPPFPEEHQVVTPKMKQQFQNLAIEHGVKTVLSLLRDLYHESQARKQGMSFDD